MEAEFSTNRIGTARIISTMNTPREMEVLIQYVLPIQEEKC